MVRIERMDLTNIWEQSSALLGKAIGWSACFLLPIKPVMLAIIFLVGMDLITGIWAAYKRGERISSNGWRRTITKTLAYMSAIICSHVMNVYFLGDMVDSVKIVAGLIAVTEFQSLMENLGSITGKDLWKELLSAIQGKKINPVPRDIPQIEEKPKKKSKSRPKRK